MLRLSDFLFLVYESEVILKILDQGSSPKIQKAPRHWVSIDGFLWSYLWQVPTTAEDLGLDQYLVFHKDLYTLRTRKALRVKVLKNLNFGMFISHLPHATAWSTHMLRTGGLTMKDKDFFLMLCNFHWLPFMAFHLHLNCVQEEAETCASEEAFLLPLGRRWL